MKLVKLSTYEERPLTSEGWVKGGVRDTLATLAALTVNAGISGVDRIYRVMQHDAEAQPQPFNNITLESQTHPSNKD